MGWAVFVGTVIAMIILRQTVGGNWGYLALVVGVAVYLVAGVAREMRPDHNVEEKE